MRRVRRNGVVIEIQKNYISVQLFSLIRDRVQSHAIRRVFGINVEFEKS